MPKLAWFEIYGVCGDRMLERDFEFQCDAIAALYERNFHGNIRLPSARKLAVYVRSEMTRDHLSELGIVLVVEVIDDLRGFFGSSDRQKAERALKWLHQACLVAAGFFGWPLEPFERARQSVIDADYVNRWVHRYKAARPDRRYRAELHCEASLRSFHSDVVVFGRDGHEVARVADLAKEPSRMIYGWHLGKMRWLSDSEIEISATQGSGKRVINLASALNA